MNYKNKVVTPSRLINLALIVVFFLSFFTHDLLQSFMRTVSLYGLSGSLTNELAIIMIFEKIPGIIGSGIIEENFEAFKTKLRETLMHHLFKHGIQIPVANPEVIGEQLYLELKNSELGFFAGMISSKTITTFLSNIDLDKMLQQPLSAEKIDLYLQTKLDELSPKTIRDLIYHVMQEHLQYLVVWGGVLGAAIGAFAWKLSLLA